MKHPLFFTALLASVFFAGHQPAHAARKPRPGATATPSPAPSPTPSPAPSPTATPSPVQSTNLLTNPGFESGATGWDIWANTSVVSGQSHSGTYAMRTGTGAGGFGQNILSKVVAGKAYRLTFFGRANSTAEVAAVNVVIKNSSNVALVSKQVILDSSVYKQYAIDFTMPSGAASALVSFWKSTASTYYAYLDDFNLAAVGGTTSPSPTPTATVAPSPTPTIAPSPSPTLSAGMNALGTQLWKADHEAANQLEWDPGNSGVEGGEFNTGNADSTISTVVSRSGVYSLKMSIDTTSGTMHGTRNYRYKEPGAHMDLIHTVYYYFPTKIDLDPTNAWINIQQWKAVKYAPGGPGTGPDQFHRPLFALGLGVRGGAGSGGANYLNLGHLLHFWGGTTVFYTPSVKVDIPVGRWVKVQIRLIQSRTGVGRLMIWQDDILLLDLKNLMTLPPESDALHWSVNNYADRTYPIQNTIFIDDASIHLPK